VVNMGYEKTGLVHVRHIYSELKWPTLKHLPQIILTTALIEAWYGAFTMHYQPLPSSHSTFNSRPSPQQSHR
jgi:hypothetical protein